MKFFAGIDVGSLTTDAVVLDNEGGIIGYSIVQTAANSTEAAEESLN